MATFTEQLATEYNFPNITIYKQFRDDVHYGYRIISNEGYVMYDVTDEFYEIDEETGQEVQVIRYFTSCHAPLSYPLGEDTFPWRAVLRSSVDENYIFNLPGEDHEIM